LLKIVKLHEVEIAVSEFMSKNSMELEFTGEGVGEGVSS
jgi:hypothetical protein